MNRDELLQIADDAGIKVDGRWSDTRLMEAIQAEGEKLATVTPITTEDTTLDDMNALALRIWEGQSPDVPMIDRIARIKIGLNNQGYEDLSALELPADDYKRYL